MNILKKRNRSEEISSSSLSDIAFLLIIFFMVTSVFILREGLVTLLPKSISNPVTVENKDLLNIEINPNGVVMINTDEYPITAVKEICLNDEGIARKIAKIRINPKVAYKDVVYVIGELQSIGVTKLSIKKKDIYD